VRKTVNLLVLVDEHDRALRCPGSTICLHVEIKFKRLDDRAPSLGGYLHPAENRAILENTDRVCASECVHVEEQSIDRAGFRAAERDEQRVVPTQGEQLQGAQLCLLPALAAGREQSRPDGASRHGVERNQRTVRRRQKKQLAEAEGVAHERRARVRASRPRKRRRGGRVREPRNERYEVGRQVLRGGH
jgi:hypothetical protein